MAREKVAEASVAEVVDFLRVTGRFLPAAREVVERKLTIEAAKKKGLEVTTQELQEAADAFRSTNGLMQASATEAWMNSVGISVEALEDYLEANLLISKFMDTLEGNTPPEKYLSSRAVKDVIRRMSYLDWLNEQVK